MTAFEPYKTSAKATAEAVLSGALHPKDLVDAYTDRIAKRDAELNCITTTNDLAIASQLEDVTSRLAAKEEMPLAGVPILVKDNICTRGMPTTCASQILQNFVSPYEATAVAKLRAAGAIVLAKTNMDEFAMGSSNENSSLGSVSNPWQLNAVPGGSSGGSAAAVAADFAPLALGSDTGGSIRQPASFCGVVGLKPTYGAISRYGLVAFGSSLDQIGPLGRSVQDCALAASVMIGQDDADSTSIKAPYNPRELATIKPGAPKKIGVIKEFLGEGIDAAVQASIATACDVFRDQGTEVLEISIPEVAHSIATYYLIATAEASANLARYDGVRYGKRVSEQGGSLRDMYKNTRSQGFGREVKQRIMLGTFALSAGYYDAYYNKASAVRRASASRLLAREIAPSSINEAARLMRTRQLSSLLPRAPKLLRQSS